MVKRAFIRNKGDAKILFYIFCAKGGIDQLSFSYLATSYPPLSLLNDIIWPVDVPSSSQLVEGYIHPLTFVNLYLNFFQPAI